jgi:hypothetical protein
MPGVFPDYPAPVIRNAGDAEELVLMRWGTPPSSPTGGLPVTNKVDLLRRDRSPGASLVLTLSYAPLVHISTATECDWSVNATREPEQPRAIGTSERNVRLEHLVVESTRYQTRIVRWGPNSRDSSCES